MHDLARPSEVLRERLPEEMSVTKAAERLGVSRQVLSAILNGRGGISAEMDLRLAWALGTMPGFGSACRCSGACGRQSKSAPP